MITSESWGSKHAHLAMQEPMSMASHCWLVFGRGLVNGDQRRSTGSSSTSESCSRRCAIQINSNFTLHYYLRYLFITRFSTTMPYLWWN